MRWGQQARWWWVPIGAARYCFWGPPVLCGICLGNLTEKIRGKKERKRKKAKQEAMRRPQTWPTPLGPRTRSLTFPLNGSSSQQTSLGCGLFKLPIEIRLQIYDLVFGIEDIHVAMSLDLKPDPIRLEAFPCRYPEARDGICHCLSSRIWLCDARCSEMLIGPEPPTWYDLPQPGLRIMNLLLTCRML